MYIIMHLQVTCDHLIVYKGNAKIPTALKGRGARPMWQLRMTTTKNE